MKSNCGCLGAAICAYAMCICIIELVQANRDAGTAVARVSFDGRGSCAAQLEVCQSQPWIAFNRDLSNSLQATVIAAWSRVYSAKASPADIYNLNEPLAMAAQEVIIAALRYCFGSHGKKLPGMGGTQSQRPRRR